MPPQGCRKLRTVMGKTSHEAKGRVASLAQVEGAIWLRLEDGTAPSPGHHFSQSSKGHIFPVAKGPQHNLCVSPLINLATHSLHLKTSNKHID